MTDYTEGRNGSVENRLDAGDGAMRDGQIAESCCLAACCRQDLASMDNRQSGKLSENLLPNLTIAGQADGSKPGGSGAGGGSLEGNKPGGGGSGGGSVEGNKPGGSGGGSVEGNKPGGSGNSDSKGHGDSVSGGRSRGDGAGAGDARAHENTHNGSR